MNGLGDARPAAAETGTAADSRQPADERLFARKGGATPAPAHGGRPAIYLIDKVDQTGDGPAPDAGVAETASDAAPGTAGDDRGAAGDSDDSGTIATLFGPAENAEAHDRTTATAPPAASLDAAPFDPSRRRRMSYDDAPPAKDEPDGAPPVAATAAPPIVAARPRLLTFAVSIAAVAATVAAVIATITWSQVGERAPAYDAATAAAPVAARPVLSGTPAPVDTAAVDPPLVDPRLPPIIDLVRIEPDGSTLIAGRGVPGTVLIVLDNDDAIGSASVGPGGDWMMAPARPLAGGSHEIALAIRTGEGTISVAAPPAASAATPRPRPAGAIMPGPRAGARYLVQIASVKTAEGAAREWTKLRSGLPDLLDNLEPTIDTAELSDRGTFHRIRLGPFADRDKAHALCAALNAAGRDCLVLRR